MLLQDESVASASPGKVAQQSTNLLYTGEQFDTDAQQYYMRARYYDPLNGRFNRVDPYSGSTQDPQSLHKYLYCHANPVNGIDPTGLWFFADMGQSVHREIAKMYRLEHSKNVIMANYFAIPGIDQILKPDIMDFTLKQIAEIKPLNIRQMSIGSAKLVGYLAAANLAKIEGGGWKPSKWDIGIRIVPLPDYPEWTIVTTGNYFGLLPYVRYKMPREKIENALKFGLTGALAYKLKEIAERVKNKQNSGLEGLEGLVYEIQNTMDGIIIYGAAHSSIRNVTMATTAGMAAYIGVRMTIAPMTARYGF